MALTKVDSGLVNQLASSNMPTGSVLQVVSSNNTTQVEGSFATATDLMSASITPKFSTSKILVLVAANGLGTRGNATYWDGLILRNSTNIGAFCNYMTSYTGGSNGTWVGDSACLVDSPATTSSTTYKLQGIRRTGSDNCVFNIATGNANITTVSTITLMEIAV